MVDPFLSAARREQLTKAGWLALLIALLCIATFSWVRANVSDGREVKGAVVRIGTYADPLGTGDLPILTVRLPDGSIREVRASWQAANGCAPGRVVSLLQRGTALQVGLRGCSRTRS
ncbi:MAG: hypothetical protein ACJ8EZ_11735, partial [Sphingomicrobium sp.]